jgi:hypothetical protein|tara:strand:- start:504 stop:746 length:243 start_codon:yes stop_codon:yes gene_type:complete
MLENLMSGLVDTEKMTYDTIQTTLEELAIELKCEFSDFWVMIKPTSNEFDMKFYVYQNNESGAPRFAKEISLKKILGKEE